jgi:trans-aconitate methyltransferase
MTKPNQPRGLAPVLRAASFSGLQDGARLLAEQVLAALPMGERRRVLDLGCGAGDIALLVHLVRPAVQVCGIDFARANIAAAQQRTAGKGISFVCADYLEWRGGNYDLIFADSVLHLIDAPVAQLAAKLAADLTAGGLVIATVPDTAVVNQVHLALRRLWRWMPPAADRLLLAMAVRLYPALPRQVLADRLPYLRLLPRLFGTAEQHAFAATGLILQRNDPWPGPSLAKLRHRLMIWRRAA